jgi:hypothetical protein
MIDKAIGRRSFLKLVAAGLFGAAVSPLLTKRNPFQREKTLKEADFYKKHTLAG